jgi:hypothetical protein
MNTKGKTKTWETMKTSKDIVDRTAYFIATLSPHNLWKGRDAINGLLASQKEAVYQQGRAEAIEEVKRLRTWSETEQGMERSLDHTGEFILIKDIDLLHQSTREVL